jgi:carboxymethylenebutenolidase
MGESIEFSRPDGAKCPGYLALPPGGKDAPAVVVIQEWWGLNDQIQGVADRVAAQGYRALVPDLYRGKIAGDANEANHMMTGLDFGAAATQDTRGAVQHLKQYANRKVAVMGFCMGGALTLIAGAFVPEVDAGVCYYGIPPRDAFDPAQIKVPLLAHFAQKDDWCTPDNVDFLESRLKEGGMRYELHRYDAQHAFVNEKRPEVYDAQATELAWQRTLAFLKRELA